MSANARRLTAKLAHRVDVPKVPKVTEEQRLHLPLLDRVLLQEHQRHADRLAEIRRVGDKLGALDGIVQAAQADGACIVASSVRESFRRHKATPTAAGRGVYAVVIWTADPFVSFQVPQAQNALANALLAAGWHVVDVWDGSGGSRASVTFMRGRRAVEVSCLQQWVLDAIEAGHITAATPGRHPAEDTSKPLNATPEGAAALDPASAA